ncbi:MAG: hypothetical protein AB7E95_07465 [Kiritimatiellales bacterium]
MKVYGLAIIAVLFTWITSSRAELLAYEGFDYTVGEELSAQSAWEAHYDSSQGNTTIAEGSLSYGSLQTSGNMASIPSGTSVGSDTYSFSNTNTDIYVSFLFNCASGAASLLTDPKQFFRFTSGSTYGMALFIQRNATDTNTFDFLIHKRGNTSQAETTSVLQGLAEDQTYLVVMQYDTSGSTGVMNIWLNPTDEYLGSGSAPAATFSSTSGNDTDVAMDTLRLGMMNRSDSNESVQLVDELRIGITWADVTTSSARMALILITQRSIEWKQM